VRLARASGLTIAALLLAAPAAHAQLADSLADANTPVQQNFNTLAASGTTNTAMPIGFAFFELGTGSTVTYAADDGALTTNNTYSYGSIASSDRALGALDGATVQSRLVGLFRNDTGATIPTVGIGYAGEEWRLGVADGTFDQLDFEYSTDATSAFDGTWTDVDALDFVTPANTTAGAKNGNSAANRTNFLPVAIPANVPPDGLFWVRWIGTTIAGANDGLGIDDFQIVPVQPDLDGDGRPDAGDNCTGVANPGQEDGDADGSGDACDPIDIDGDGVLDASDNCPTVANTGQANGDGDGAGDACDPLTATPPPAATGQRAAAVKRCKKFGGHRRKRCLKKANKLPV
jgi:Thrombospondin type 3 repeat